MSSTATLAPTADRLQHIATRMHLQAVVAGKIRAMAEAGLIAERAPKGARFLVVSDYEGFRAPRFENARKETIGDVRDASSAYWDLQVEPDSSTDAIWERRRLTHGHDWVLDLRTDWLDRAEQQARALELDLDQVA